MKKNIKFLSFFLALVMLVLAVPFSLGDSDTVSAEGSYNYSISVYNDNKPVSDLILHNGDKEELEARGDADFTEYTWEIQLPEILGWTEISGMNTERCDVSPAVLRGMFDIKEKAAVRCSAKINGETVISDPVFIAFDPTSAVEETPVQSSKAPMRRKAPAKAANDDPNIVTVTINYVMDDGTVAATSYIATLPIGQSFNATIPSPTVPGYAPYDKDGNPAENVVLSFSSLVEDTDIEITYKPAMVSYSVKYYLQNIVDDNYVEDVSLSGTGTAITGTYPEKDLEIPIEGFTCIIHEPAVVAADGSTVFHLYYDRNYYLYQFDCDGGFGIDPVYARYGTSLTIRAPEKLGYDFGGWLKITKDADGNEVAEKIDEIPGTIGSENCNFRAVWTEREDARFTVVYWRENPDDPGYGYWGEKIVTGVKSGSAIDTALFDKYDIPTPKTGNGDEDIHEDELQHYTYNEEKTLENIPAGGVVAGDGSTIINVYYTRNLYTLRFIFARSYEEWDYWAETSNTVYEVPGGSTYAFGNYGPDSYPGNEKPTNNLSTLLNRVKCWGTVSEKPSPVAEMKYDVKDFTDSGYTYYYFDVTRKYGAILNDVWPTTERMNKVQLPSARNGKRYAVFSAWNGECYIKYTQENDNETIKGRYLRLDDDLLYAQQYQKRLTVQTIITVTKTETV